MQKNGYRLGGEESGHIIFSKYATTGDGLITAIKIMEAFIESKLPISKLVEDFRIYPQVTKNVRVADKDAVLSDPDVLAAKKAVEDSLGTNGRILLRKSGTEPLIRVMVEAPETEDCETFSGSVVDVIVKKGFAVER